MCCTTTPHTTMGGGPTFYIQEMDLLSLTVCLSLLVVGTIGIEYGVELLHESCSSKAKKQILHKAIAELMILGIISFLTVNVIQVEVAFQVDLFDMVRPHLVCCSLLRPLMLFSFISSIDASRCWLSSKWHTCGCFLWASCTLSMPSCSPLRWTASNTNGTNATQCERWTCNACFWDWATSTTMAKTTWCVKNLVIGHGPLFNVVVPAATRSLAVARARLLGRNLKR